jgi:hypothetical protein
MTANLENELRRALADPPVALPEVADPVPDLDRRVTRARHRRSAVAVLSVAAVLAAGVGGASALTRRAVGPGPVSAISFGPIRPPAAGPPAAAADIAPPPEVVAAARTALTGVVSGTPAGPVLWVAVGSGEYIVQIHLTGTATCKYCRDPAAGADPVRGSVIEVTVQAKSTVDAAGRAPGASAPVPSPTDGNGSGWKMLARATDLSRFGTVHEFPFPAR